MKRFVHRRFWRDRSLIISLEKREQRLFATVQMIRFIPAQKEPSAEQFQKMLEAAMDTNGIILRRDGVNVCAFFRAGSLEKYLNEDCVFTGDENSEGWKSHQAKVTYNWGKSGSDVIKSTSGSLSAKANSGCYSQNGAMCLAKKGWAWENIVRFFYGMDIGIERVEGACITHPKCETQLDGGSTIIDDRNECFTRNVSDNYFVLGKKFSSSADTIGYDDSLQFAYAWDKPASAVGTWKVNVKKPGKYLVSAYIDSKAGNLSQKAPYQVRASKEEKTVVVDLTGKNGWVEIGKFEFAAGEDQWVKLTDATGEPFTDKTGKRVVFDALKFDWANHCTDECSEKGAKECHGTGYRVCEDSNGDSCYEWSEDKACSGSEVCRDGACHDPNADCTNECSEGEAECVNNGGGYRKCGQFDADYCFEWSVVENCGAGMICDNAACVANENLACTNDCAEGRGECDEDECLEGSGETACEENAVCKRGVCEEDEKTEAAPRKCLTEIDGKQTFIDELDDCFEKSDSYWWKKMDGYGYDDHLYYATAREDNEGAVGTWHLNVTKSGEYDIDMYVETAIGDIASPMNYTIRAAGKTYKKPLEIDTDADEKWIRLGTFKLEAGEAQYIRLTDIGSYDSDSEVRVVFDAVRVTPVSSEDDSGSGQGVGGNVIVSSSSSCSIGSTETGNPWGMWLLFSGFAGLGLIRRRRVSGK